MWTYDDKLSFLYLNMDKVVKNSTPAFSMRSRRVEVVDERENGRARGRLACLLLARPFFLVPTTSKRLLRWLAYIWRIVRFQIDAIKFERTQIQFFSDVLTAVVVVVA